MSMVIIDKNKTLLENVKNLEKSMLVGKILWSDNTPSPWTMRELGSGIRNILIACYIPEFRDHRTDPAVQEILKNIFSDKVMEILSKKYTDEEVSLESKRDKAERMDLINEIIEPGLTTDTYIECVMNYTETEKKVIAERANLIRYRILYNDLVSHIEYGKEATLLYNKSLLIGMPLKFEELDEIGKRKYYTKALGELITEGILDKKWQDRKV